ncbi:hypothetical protein IFM61606_08501 [Aspergillus udagawae]|uniref:Rhodopsin domain-containing protein n=2 Tax=Aspergillus udagawae TaxID=91492 RepID=A0A8H3SEN1_9EURO|nr:uncharacterized protein Aud_005763 [Aspergillus udagawae]GFF22476.1 hypothetical protein IFM61606_08501 [Aspergillus udagawae]GFF57577.1 hypothetical protein IFM51744_09260 [Aspergillus udagawae]GFF96480.1 hypothetical protein IFM53868_08562 [Aspergillus udagawae]GFG17354.1 hypothetical protein IFM5058_08431 [Aspergillus udagawae]GIC89350.1 hypothetical protein Aud_005763 [Aspergillus udagawae]
MHGPLGHFILSRDEDDGASRGQQAVEVTGVLTGLAILIVAMRLFARIGLMKLRGREDYTIVVALVFSIVYFALVAAQVHFGLGIHSDKLPAATLKQQLKRLWIAIPFYNASLAFSKFSILFQYLRIFPSRRFRFACYFVMGIVALYSTWAIVSAFVNCVPVARFWDRDIPGSCLSFEAVWFFNASMNIATDLTLLIMPMPLISHLQLPRMQKVALMAVFAVGLLVVITSILRLSSLRTVAQSPDTSYSNVGAAYWTAAECNVAIICACLPFLRPLISRIFPRLLSTKSYNKYTGQPTMTANRSRKTQVYSQDPDYGLYTIDIEATDLKRGSTGGIEVTTEMTVQETSQHDESTSQRRLVIQS